MGDGSCVAQSYGSADEIISTVLNAIQCFRLKFSLLQIISLCEFSYHYTNLVLVTIVSILSYLNIFYSQIHTIGLNTSFTSYMKFFPVSCISIG